MSFQFSECMQSTSFQAEQTDKFIPRQVKHTDVVSPRQDSLVTCGSRSSSLKTAKDEKEEIARRARTIKFQRQKSFDLGSFLSFESLSDEDNICKVTSTSRKRNTRYSLLRQPSSFTGEEIESLQAAFSKLDQDGNGCLSHEEVHTALGDMIPQEDIKSLLEEMDADGDGEINYQVLTC